MSTSPSNTEKEVQSLLHRAALLKEKTASVKKRQISDTFNSPDSLYEFFEEFFDFTIAGFGLLDFIGQNYYFYRKKGLSDESKDRHLLPVTIINSMPHKGRKPYLFKKNELIIFSPYLAESDIARLNGLAYLPIYDQRDWPVAYFLIGEAPFLRDLNPLKKLLPFEKNRFLPPFSESYNFDLQGLENFNSLDDLVASFNGQAQKKTQKHLFFCVAAIKLRRFLSAVQSENPLIDASVLEKRVIAFICKMIQQCGVASFLRPHTVVVCLSTKTRVSESLLSKQLRLALLNYFCDYSAKIEELQIMTKVISCDDTASGLLNEFLSIE